MTHEEVLHIPKEPLKFSNLFGKKFGEHAWVWLLNMWNNERNTKLSQARFIGGFCTQRFCVNVAVQGDEKDSDWLVAWLAKTGIKR